MACGTAGWIEAMQVQVCGSGSWLIDCSGCFCLCGLGPRAGYEGWWWWRWLVWWPVVRVWWSVMKIKSL